MTFDPAFLEIMTDTVVLRRATGSTNGYGAGSEVYSPDETIEHTRVVKRPVQVRTTDGTITVARASVTFPGIFGVRVVDQIQLPDGTTPKILMVESFPDEDGPHHEKAYLG